MLKVNGKCFMNIQEAVQWLLENNALPFQSTANYVANTEIAMSTLVAPAPAKVRVGSLIFFADSKVATVTGVTSNGYIVSAEYNNLVDDVVYVTGVEINASGHLITTLSNGDTVDAGLIKQLSSFSINASQHLIANYNDGTSSDLGAIFQGDVVISGSLEQTTPNYDSGALTLGTVNPNTLDYEVIFAKFQVVNQTLKAVFVIKVTNNTASPINFKETNTSIFDLPAKYRSKIIDVLGNDLTVIDNQSHLIRGATASIIDPTSFAPITFSSNVGFVLTHYNSALTIRFITDYSGVAIPANTSYVFFGEMNLTLI